jgi:preprotein translocase subunit SecD
MTTLQKSLITATIAVLAGAGIHEARQASRWRNEVQSLQQQQTPLAEQIAQLKADNEKLSHQITMATQSSALSSDRLRELLKLRGEVGLLRRELKQAFAAQSNVSGITEQATAAAPPTAPAPFQIQLVTDEAAEDSEPIMNNLSTANGENLYVQKTPLLDYTAIKAAVATRNASSGTPEIDVEFNDVGSELFAVVTAANLNKRLAIVLDGRLYSAPVIRSPIAGGKARITGNFSEDEARDLASKINQAIRLSDARIK